MQTSEHKGRKPVVLWARAGDFAKEAKAQQKKGEKRGEDLANFIKFLTFAAKRQGGLQKALSLGELQGKSQFSRPPLTEGMVVYPGGWLHHPRGWWFIQGDGSTNRGDGGLSRGMAPLTEGMVVCPGGWLH